MIDTLYEIMRLPESCRLGKRVFKKQFHEHGKLSASDKKALSDDVDTIVWQYALKPSLSKSCLMRMSIGNITKWPSYR